jgi:hypothetical protein
VVPFTWTIYIKEKQYHFSIWKNVDPLTIYFQLIIIFFVCLIHIVMRFFFQLFWLSTKCQEQSNILEKQNGKRVCVKDEWKCLLLLYIIISLFCLSKCKTNVVTKLIFENSCHTLVRWWCKGIYKILTIGGKKFKKREHKHVVSSQYTKMFNGKFNSDCQLFSAKKITQLTTNSTSHKRQWQKLIEI